MLSARGMLLLSPSFRNGSGWQWALQISLVCCFFVFFLKKGPLQKSLSSFSNVRVKILAQCMPLLCSQNVYAFLDQKKKKQETKSYPALRAGCTSLELWWVLWVCNVQFWLHFVKIKSHILFAYFSPKILVMTACILYYKDLLPSHFLMFPSDNKTTWLSVNMNFKTESKYLIELVMSVT